MLGAAFAELLAEAYRNDGSLLKFGGDALLLLFDGPGHVDRAAPLGLRHAPPAALAGRAADLGGQGHAPHVAGHAQRRGAPLLRRGQLAPRADRQPARRRPPSTGMEKLAGAGEIAISAATAARVPEVWLGARRGPGWLLTSAPEGPRARPDRAAVAAAAPAPSSSSSRARSARTSPAASRQPEHRVVTTAFLRFEGVDALIAERGARGRRRRDRGARRPRPGRRGRVRGLLPAVRRRRGRRQAHAHRRRAAHGRRRRGADAARAAPDRRAPRRLPLRIGVNRGSVFCGDVGAPFRRAYTIMGDAVNLAARLMAHAPARRGLRHAGRAGALRHPLRRQADGRRSRSRARSEPVEAWSVGSPLGSRAQRGHRRALPARRPRRRSSHALERRARRAPAPAPAGSSRSRASRASARPAWPRSCGRAPAA